MKKTRKLLDSSFYQLVRNLQVIAVSYQCKANRNVILFSSMHGSPSIDETTPKQKPEMIVTYYQTKSGVDMVDSMLRNYSTKAASRRWLIGIFYDILDKAALNA